MANNVNKRYYCSVPALTARSYVGEFAHNFFKGGGGEYAHTRENWASSDFRDG